MRLAGLWEDQDLVFPSRIGTPISGNNLSRRHFKPLLTRAGLPNIRLYDLRHLFATSGSKAASTQRFCKRSWDTPGSLSRWTPTVTPFPICRGKRWVASEDASQVLSNLIVVEVVAAATADNAHAFVDHDITFDANSSLG